MISGARNERLTAATLRDRPRAGAAPEIWFCGPRGLPPACARACAASAWAARASTRRRSRCASASGARAGPRPWCVPAAGEQAEQLLALARVENLALGDQLLDDQALLVLLQLGDRRALGFDAQRVDRPAKSARRGRAVTPPGGRRPPRTAAGRALRPPPSARAVPRRAPIPDEGRRRRGGGARPEPIQQHGAEHAEVERDRQQQRHSRLGGFIACSRLRRRPRPADRDFPVGRRRTRSWRPASCSLQAATAALRAPSAVRPATARARRPRRNRRTARGRSARASADGLDRSSLPTRSSPALARGRASRPPAGGRPAVRPDRPRGGWRERRESVAQGAQLASRRVARAAHAVRDQSGAGLGGQGRIDEGRQRFVGGTAREGRTLWDKSYSWEAPVCGSKCSSKVLRARARRDFTVPSAMPRTLASSP